MAPSVLQHRDATVILRLWRSSAAMSVWGRDMMGTADINWLASERSMVLDVVGRRKLRFAYRDKTDEALHHRGISELQTWC